MEIRLIIDNNIDFADVGDFIKFKDGNLCIICKDYDYHYFLLDLENFQLVKYSYQICNLFNDDDKFNYKNIEKYIQNDKMILEEIN